MVALRTVSSPAESLVHEIQIGSVRLFHGDALMHIPRWQAPTVIISDGAYGVSGFPGDPPTHKRLDAWYEPHVRVWSTAALPETTLWFWNTEVGWATVHPVLAKHGWVYRGLHIWDKTVAHVAGNVNSKTIRRFPIVTEVCAQYVRDVRLPTVTGERLSLQQWLRYEWKRSGLPLNRTNEACGVKNAATRKYFTADHLWYFPPPEMMERLAQYANERGKPTEKPYFSLDGSTPVRAAAWEKMRAKWHHVHGITNVWRENAIRGDERLKTAHAKTIHLNQKPLSLMKRIIEASSDVEDVVWEPFGGLCSAAVASLQTGRVCFASEINSYYVQMAKERLCDALEASSATNIASLRLI